MILTLLGCMHIFNIPLGITAALALSLVIGMSVDYIIHIAHAYSNSLFTDRFYKSRATIFARAHSIASAAATTFGAVLPLLIAQLLPLREFGQVRCEACESESV
jgi:protein dispatched 1